MGKISAAKKMAKRKDFQKTKLKVGRKLPKNTNETRATFKAKTLIIKQQFQLEKEGPVSHRNLSWKELMAHLGHHNQSIKLDAIFSIKEMIVANQDLIKTELGTFLENVCPLFIDREYKVREAVMQLFKTFILLPSIKKKHVLEPFYGLINVHLSCAMTNISENVQYSSLKLLDIIIENIPDLVRIHAYSIFENFIDQISKASLKGDKRTLKNDPYKMTSTQTWRNNVLNRLYRMLLIVSVQQDLKKVNHQEKKEVNENEIDQEELNFNSDLNNWKIHSNFQVINLNFDEIRECSITSYQDDTSKSSLKICKRLTNKKNLTEIKEFFETYFKVVSPLLVDCWIEAKPENKKIIDNYESLSIMNSVLSIMNLLLDNLNFDFIDLVKQLRTATKITNQVKYIENMFLSDFPYMLSENFDYTSSDSKKFSSQISASTINLLLCKFCSSSLLKLSQEKLFGIFDYSLKSLGSKKESENLNIQQQMLSLSELHTLLKLSETIFKNFTRIEIIKPFLLNLITYYDSLPKFSNNKWLVFEFLCKEFYENDNFSSKNFDHIFLTFYKKIFKYCIAFEKEKKENLEDLIDWLRKLIIRKEKSQKIILSLLEDEYINMLNALDFESKETNELCKKKLLELVNWLPKINRFLFSKLSILIIGKKLSIFNTNQILGIIKTRLERNDSTHSFDQSDYLMFLMNLFNGYCAFDLSNNSSLTKNNESFFFDHFKFHHHQVLCQHLEEFILSHNDSNVIIEILLSTSIPIFIQMKSISCSTLYGSLCLISKQSNLCSTSDIYTHIICWIVNGLFWLLNSILNIQNEQLGTKENVQEDLNLLNKILNKMNQIFQYKQNVLNDCVPKIITLLQKSKDIDHIREMFVLINYLLGNFSQLLSPSKEYFLNVYTGFKALSEAKYLWWYEFENLIKLIM